MFIDTHSHLYLGELQYHIPEAINHVKKNNFSHIIQIGTSLDTSKLCLELAKTYDIVFATIGIHPCEAQDMGVDMIPEVIREFEHVLIKKEVNKIVWIWEIGFDHYHLSSQWKESEVQKKRQVAWFHAQARLAQKYDLPVVIHTRKCPQLTLEELKKSGLKRFVIHCFSEDRDFAERIWKISPEAKISFTGILTYPQSKTVQETAIHIPLEKIMLETDAPFLIPENLKKEATYCEPVHTLEVFRKLSSLRKEPQDTIEQILWQNSKTFFNLP